VYVYICLAYFIEIPCFLSANGNRGSSGSIVSDFGLDDRVIGVRSPAEAKDFSCSLWVQTVSGAHPASCTMGTGGPFPEDEVRPRRDADHSPLSTAEVVNENYTSFPPKRLHGVWWDSFTFYLKILRKRNDNPESEQSASEATFGT
jgi:hypothetical protein